MRALGAVKDNLPVITIQDHNYSVNIPQGEVSYKYFLYEAVKYNYKKFERLNNVAECESRWNPTAVGKAQEYGVYQYKRATFDSFKAESGMKDLVYENPFSQILLTVWAFDHGKAGHWSCAR